MKIPENIMKTIITILLISGALFGQVMEKEVSVKQNELKMRKLYLGFNAGSYRMISIGGGYQFSEKISATLRIAGADNQRFPNNPGGLGAGLNFHHDLYLIDTFSFEYFSYLWSPFMEHSGNILGLFAGNYQYDEPGLKFVWTVGVSYRKGFDGSSIEGVYKFTPDINIGLNYNFER